MREFNKLVGWKITSVEINDEKDIIIFNCKKSFGEQKKIYAVANGDCCSKSWFEHITGLDALIKQEVRGVEEREMPKDTESPDGDVTRYYGCLIITERGRCEIEMRNTSNGYYGGEASVGEAPIGQYGDILTEIATKKIKDDF